MLAWHDISQASKKKAKPYETAWPDLARAAVKAVPNQPLNYKVGSIKMMMQAYHQDYYPKVAFDGKNYLIIFGGTTSDLINFNPNLGCLVGIVICGYVSQDAKLLDAFYIKAEDGGGAGSASLCFGNNEGLLVYEHTDINQYSTISHRKLRLRFIAKT